MDRTIAQDLHQRQHGLAVVDVRTEIVNTRVDERARARDEDGDDNSDCDAVVFDVLSHGDFLLEPDANAGEDLPVKNGLTILPRILGGRADTTHKVHADVRRKLAVMS